MDGAAAGAARDVAGSAETGGAGSSHRTNTKAKVTLGETWVHVTREQCAGHHWGTGCGHVFSKNTKNSSLDYEELLEQIYITFGGIYLASSVAVNQK